MPNTSKGVEIDPVKEKLIELLKSNPYANTPDSIADHLIANGVTVQDNTKISDEFLEQLRNAPVAILQEEPTIEVMQEWISVKDRLPGYSVKYIVVADSKYHSDMRVVSAKSLMVEEFWGMPMGYFAHGQQVTHWMPLPQPPKGE